MEAKEETLAGVEMLKIFLCCAKLKTRLIGSLGSQKKKNYQNDFLWKMKYFDVTAKSLGLRIFLQGKQMVKYDRQIFSAAGSRKGELWSHRRVQRSRFGVLRLKRV